MTVATMVERNADDAMVARMAVWRRKRLAGVWSLAVGFVLASLATKMFPHLIYLKKKDIL
jgi:hypothetical protein